MENNDPYQNRDFKRDGNKDPYQRPDDEPKHGWYNDLDKEQEKKPEEELSENELEELEIQKKNDINRREKRLQKLGSEVFNPIEISGSGDKDNPFIRMLFSIPLFGLFWLIYWKYF